MNNPKGGLGSTAERRNINIALLVVISAVAAVVVWQLAGNYQRQVVLPVVGLRIQASAPAAAGCDLLGHTTSGTEIWLGACVAAVGDTKTPGPTETQTPAPIDTDTAVPASGTPVPASSTPVPATGTPAAATNTPKPVGATATRTPTRTATGAAPATGTPVPVTVVPSPTLPGPILPFPEAPACPDNGPNHDNSVFHTLWDGVRACHYDHEHGLNPFTQAVRDALGGIDIRAFTGGVGVGHRNPSSPAENVAKHGGFKWNVQLVQPESCAPFQGTDHGTSASVVQFHSFGDQAIEFEPRVHSVVAFIAQCDLANPDDKGYIAVAQHLDFGQRVIPYQGTIVAYPNQPAPAYSSARKPYVSGDCVDNVPPTVIQCRSSLQQVIDRNLNVTVNWVSGPENTGGHFGSKVFHIIFRGDDNYKLFDWNDQQHPFTWLWVCSSDGGIDYNPSGCRYNNSEVQVAEIGGEVRAEWDNLAGFDTDARVGRVTADGYLTAFGESLASCDRPGDQCFPIHMQSAYVGSWGGILRYTNERKGTDVPGTKRDGDIYFCGQTVCASDAPGAVPSGWIGPNN